MKWKISMFQGPAALTLDGKGRIAIPVRHRAVLDAMQVKELTITKHPDGPLVLYPRPTWMQLREKLATLPVSANGWKRVLLGNAMDVELDDNSSRILIAPELRAAAGLKRDLMMLGMGNCLELWDAEAYAAHEAKVMQSEPPEALKDFSF